MNIRPFGQRSRGCVYLVGAGPGDPELLTLKAVRLLEQADVIVYDNLVSSDFEVIPGVTAACGVASYAGIPLTHRDHAQGCLFVTGHLKDGSANLDWDALVRPNQTVVIYMGLNALPDICRQLMAHGAPATRPIAAVQHGTLSTQQVLTGTLSDLPAKVAVSGFTSPSLLIVGDVVKLHGTLHWFDPQTGAASQLSPAHHEVPQQLPALNAAAAN